MKGFIVAHVCPRCSTRLDPRRSEEGYARYAKCPKCKEEVLPEDKRMYVGKGAAVSSPYARADTESFLLGATVAGTGPTLLSRNIGTVNARPHNPAAAPPTE